MAFMLIAACSLVLMSLASVPFTPSGEIKTGLEDHAFDFRCMSHIHFGVHAISSRKPVLVAFSLVREGAAVKM